MQVGSANMTADTWEEAQTEYAALGDGLPLVPPTSGRVARMLGDLDPDELVATLAPCFGEATWRALAENAVMAGCLPEYLPVIAAAAAAVAETEFNLLGIQTTTGNAAPMIIVNGEVKTMGKYPVRYTLAHWAGVAMAKPVELPVMGNAPVDKGCC